MEAIVRLTLTHALPHTHTRALTHMPMGIEHYSDVIMSPMVSQITSLTIVYSTVYSCADHRKHQSSASLAFVRGNHRWPVNSPHKWPVTRKMFPFDDVVMNRDHSTQTVIKQNSKILSVIRQVRCQIMFGWNRFYYNHRINIKVAQ